MSRLPEFHGYQVPNDRVTRGDFVVQDGYWTVYRGVPADQYRAFRAWVIRTFVRNYSRAFVLNEHRPGWWIITRK